MIADRDYGTECPPNTRADSELFALARHAANLVAQETLEQGYPGKYTDGALVDFRRTRILTDDHAPVDMLKLPL